eukprot:4339137-Pyramimonas_sp.AAC.1
MLQLLSGPDAIIDANTDEKSRTRERIRLHPELCNDAPLAPLFRFPLACNRTMLTVEDNMAAFYVWKARDPAEVGHAGSPHARTPLGRTPFRVWGMVGFKCFKSFKSFEGGGHMGGGVHW